MRETPCRCCGLTGLQKMRQTTSAFYRFVAMCMVAGWWLIEGVLCVARLLIAGVAP